MAVALLDINVLIALGWKENAASGVAHQWLRTNGADGWATCGMTQLGFLRLSMNPQVVGAGASSSEALGLLQSLVGLPGHVFWPDVALTQQDPTDWAGIRGYRQVPDLYLALLAKHYGGRLVTFDRAAAKLLPSHVEVI